MPLYIKSIENQNILRENLFVAKACTKALIIAKTNKQCILSESDQKLYQQNPIQLLKFATIISIHNDKGQTYRVLRAETFTAYSYFCKLMAKNGFSLFIIHDKQLDVFFA